MRVADFKVERWMNKYELEALYNLAETDAKPFKVGELLSLTDELGLNEQLLDLKLGYNPTQGSQSLRETIAGLYENMNYENILVTNGAIEADYILSNVLVEPGDEVIVQYPAYQVLYSVAEAGGGAVKKWQMISALDFKPDLERLFSLLSENTKLVVLNNPHNPTGILLSEKEMKKIFRAAEEYDFRVLVDEVYHGITIENKQLPPFACDMSSRAISVGSMSKTFGLSGLRLGWIAGSKEIVEICWSQKDYTSISTSPVSDFLANLALTHRKKVLGRNRSIAQNNYNILLDWCEKYKSRVELRRPDAGLVCFPFFKLPCSTEEFCKKAFHEKGILLVPGECFDMPGHIRIGFGGDAETFAEGLAILGGILEEYEEN